MTSHCPKCGHPQTESDQSCPRCGVIFSRIPGEHQRPDTAPAIKPVDPGSEGGTDHGSLFLTADTRGGSAQRAIKALFLLALGIWGLRLAGQPIASNAVGESFMHLINLPFHEAGHIFFSPFGRFIQILGGTLGQLIIPAIVTATFIYQRQPYSASIGLWWLGESFMDIAPYINDARAGQLMLLGGVTGSEVEDYHDWEGILSRLGMMRYDHALARTAFVIGVLIILSAVGWGGYTLWREHRSAERPT